MSIDDRYLKPHPLSMREIEVLKLLSYGFYNKQIARELGISEQTIKNHVVSIFWKLDVSSRTQAVVTAVKQGLIVI